MQITRLVRLLHLLTLTRRMATAMLRAARYRFSEGQRALGLQRLRRYHQIKQQLATDTQQAARMLSAIIPADAAA
jgi:hypothetical protein